MVKDLLKSRKFTWCLLGIGTLIILWYYFEKVPQMNIVWELMDEFGYLANAAYLSGNKWPYVTNFYYGYGYSLWLVPLFWICNSGIQIIKGAIIINALMVAALLWVQYLLMSKVCKELNRNIIAIVSLILCFYPYIVASGLKVICEVLITLLVWVCGLLFYQALDTGKWYYYVLLSVCTVYMFFVHSRTFVFGGVMVLMAGVLFLLKKINGKQMLLSLGTAALVLVIGFAIKDQVIQNVYMDNMVQENAAASVEKYTGDIRVTSGAETLEEALADTEVEDSLQEEVVSENTPEISGEETKGNEVVNTFPITYIIEKILSIFTDFSAGHLYGFVCRNFYLFASTAGMFHLGVFAALKDAFCEWKETKKIGTASAIKVTLAAAVVMAILAVVVHSPYSLELPKYNFYGRYYEYVIGPMVCIGLDYCIRKRMPAVGKIVWLALFAIAFWYTLDFANYLEVQDLGFDSFRLAALSYFTENPYFRSVVKTAARYVAVMLIAIIGLNYFKKLRPLIPIVLLALFMDNNEVLEKHILYIQNENREDLEMAAYITGNYDVDEVYFLNSGFSFPDAYAGLQPLFGKDKLVVLDGEENVKLKEGDVFLSFRDNPYVSEMEQSLLNVYNTTYYEIYVVE